MTYVYTPEYPVSWDTESWKEADDSILLMFTRT